MGDPERSHHPLGRDGLLPVNQEAEMEEGREYSVKGFDPDLRKMTELFEPEAPLCNWQRRLCSPSFGVAF